MQVERFLSILQDLKEELNQDSLVNSINEIIALLPQASQQTQFDEIEKKLKDFLSQSKVNQYPPSKIKALTKINGTKYFGMEAFKYVENTLLSPKIYNPADKASYLASYVGEINEYKAKINAEILSLQGFGINAYRLTDSKYEVGVILSEYVTGNQIKNIQRYLEEWHLLIRYLNEITENNHENPKVSALGSNDSIEIYFENSKETASCIATAVDQIVTIYNKVLDGKRRLQSIKDDGLIDIDIEKNYEDRKRKMIDDGLEKIVTEIAEKYKGQNDSGRVNELKIGLKKSFEFIANSIDLGIDVEVNTPEPKKPVDIFESDTPEQKESKQAELIKFEKLKSEVQKIKESGNKTKYLPSDRKERVLGLPEPDMKQLENK